MRTPARAELLDVVRVLLLLQGAILVANTVEAALFAAVFSGAITPAVLATAVAAIATLVARARVDLRGRGRRAITIVEAVVLVSFGVDAALAVFFTHQPLPVVAVLTRFALPVSVLALLSRAVDRDRGPIGDAAMGQAA